MNDFKKTITEIERINRLTGAPDLTAPVRSMLDHDDPTIHVAVLGQFKSGKSSLINSLIGAEILPVGVVPVTAIVTCIAYGGQPGLKVEYLNGTSGEIPLMQLESWVTEKNNPENIKNVAVALVNHPAMEGLRYISFIDTPGLGSFYVHNTGTTRQWLPSVGVAIVAVSAERPLSQEDLELIKELSWYCKKIALVLTKTDLFNESQLNEIKSFIKNTIWQSQKKEIPLFGYSIYANNSNFRGEILDAFIRPLGINTPEKLDEIKGYKLLRLAEKSKSFALLALQAALKRENEKDSIRKLIKELEQNQHYHKDEIVLFSRNFKEGVWLRLEELVMHDFNQILTKLKIRFEKDFKPEGGLLFAYSRKFELWLKEALGDELKQIDENINGKVNDMVLEPLGYFEYSSAKFRQRLQDSLLRLFETGLPDASLSIEFTGVPHPDVSVYRAFDSHIDTLLFFLPVRVFGRLFRKHFLKQLPLETEKNLYRYISGMTEKIFKAIDLLNAQAIGFIGYETKTAIDILQSDAGNLDEVRQSLADLDLIAGELEKFGDNTK
jgi:GTPase SAR1 family protein